MRFNDNILRFNDPRSLLYISDPNVDTEVQSRDWLDREHGPHMFSKLNRSLKHTAVPVTRQVEMEYSAQCLSAERT